MKLYTIIRANSGEVVASDVVLDEASRIIGCKFKETVIQRAKEGRLYKGFRIIQKDNPDYIASGNIVSLVRKHGK